MNAHAVALVAIAAVLVTVRPGAQQADQQPIFRGGTDLIELDVSVLDRNRRALQGLTAGDFTVTEDDKPQRVTAVSFVDMGVHDPVRSARMRFVSSDVASNDLADQLGSGRLLAIVLDDVNLPADDPDIVRAARETARYVIDQLGPSDMAAVVHAQHSGRTEDFTSDRSKLLASIDAFVPQTLDYTPPTPAATGPGGGDMVQRWSPTLMRSACLRNEPAVPTLDAVTTRMATAPGRRKAIVFLSVGVPMSFGGASTCASQLSDVMRGVFRKAQTANINVYTVDPAGLNGYNEYVRQHPDLQAGSRGLRRPRSTNVRQLQDFMRVVADTTGGRAVINTNAIERAIDQIFEEDRSYYMVGYESTNGAPDGRFRRVEVKVARPEVVVRTRSGYWAPRADEAVKLPESTSPASIALAGLFGPQGLPLRAVATPVGLSRDSALGPAVMDVALVLSARWPARAVPAETQDTVTVIRNVYDATGNPGPPTRDILTVPLVPTRTQDVRHDFLQRLSLAPGRYQVRLNTQSALAGVNGSVYADIEVPDVRRASLSVAGVVLGTLPSQGETRSDALATVVPLIPTSARDFAPNERIEAFARIYQGGTGPVLPVTMVVEVINAADEVQVADTQILEPVAFGPDRGVAYQVTVPLAGLAPGPYLFGVTARLPSGFTSRRDVMIRVR